MGETGRAQASEAGPDGADAGKKERHAMARTRYAPDRGLTARMTLTMFLLGLVFVGFVAALVGILTAVHASGGAIIFFPVLLGLGLGIGSFYWSDKIALR